MKGDAERVSFGTVPCGPKDQLGTTAVTLFSGFLCSYSNGIDKGHLLKATDTKLFQ